ncbi:MAG: AraC family transcriptional regulator [Janthinobacterium lividum]
MDPLSDVLALLRVRSYLYGGFAAGGDWCVFFGPHLGSLKFYAVMTGACWLAVEGMAVPQWVQAGDCLLLPSGRAFRAGTDLALPAVDIFTLVPQGATGGTTTYQGGGDTLILGGFFTLAAEQAAWLLAVLPPVVHIRAEADQAVLRWTLAQLRQEVQAPQPGGLVLAQQLAGLLLVQVLRLHLATGEAGWLGALADPRLHAALTALHAQPARRWTVQELAWQVGMSRTSFAVLFRQRVGQPPLTYLTQWRMQLAKDRLAASLVSVAELAQALGYESEAAFSTAFKRLTGYSPRHYRQHLAAVST